MLEAILGNRRAWSLSGVMVVHIGVRPYEVVRLMLAIQDALFDTDRAQECAEPSATSSDALTTIHRSQGD